MPLVTRPHISSAPFGPMADGHAVPTAQTRAEATVTPFDRVSCRSAREWAAIRAGETTFQATAPVNPATTPIACPAPVRSVLSVAPITPTAPPIRRTQSVAHRIVSSVRTAKPVPTVSLPLAALTLPDHAPNGTYTYDPGYPILPSPLHRSLLS